MSITEYNYFQSLKWVLSRLPRRKQAQFWFSFLGMSISAIFETFALGAIAFFASAVASPESVMKSDYFETLKQVVGPDYAVSAQNLIIGSGIILIFLVLLKNIIKGMVSYWIPKFSADVEAIFGGVLLNGFLNLPYEWHLSRNSADLVMAIHWRVYLGRAIILQSLKVVNDFLLVFVMLLSLFIIQPLISFSVIITLGSFGVVIYFGLKAFLDKTATSARNKSLSANKEATTAIHGIKDIKVTKKEKKIISQFLDDVFSFAKVTALQEFVSGLPVLILETMGFTMLVLAIWMMMFFSKSSEAAITGTVSLLAVTGWRALPAVTRILASLTEIRKSLPFVANQMIYINQIEEGIISIKSIQAINQPECIFKEDISFENVEFIYQGTQIKVLHDISFTIEKGKTIGIIGISGAGKSTLVDIMTGLLPPTGGRILVDGKPLNKELLPQWLGLIGYVSQSPYILDGSLAENVAFGEKGIQINRDRVVDCCAMASIGDFIKELPNGIDTFIGERGVKISGGQKQRVAIARALYNQPEIMIFDEATSSLDTKSEKAIQKTIYSFKGKQTLIIIAHRLSTVVDCDDLIWLEKGGVKMIGKPSEVLGHYNGKNVTGSQMAN